MSLCSILYVYGLLSRPRDTTDSACIWQLSSETGIFACAGKLAFCLEAEAVCVRCFSDSHVNITKSSCESAKALTDTHARGHKGPKMVDIYVLIRSWPCVHKE